MKYEENKCMINGKPCMVLVTGEKKTKKKTNIKIIIIIIEK